MAALRSIKADEQLGMDEKVINDPDVEQALEARQRAKDELAEKRLAVKNATEKVKGLVGRLEMPDPDSGDKPIVVRVGRFRISKRFVKGKTVSFSTEDRVQLTFGLADAPDVDDTEAGYDDAVDEQAAIERLEKTSSFTKPTAVADDDLLPQDDTRIPNHP